MEAILVVAPVLRNKSTEEAVFDLPSKDASTEAVDTAGFVLGADVV
jgi:hypothetical protein